MIASVFSGMHIAFSSQKQRIRFIALFLLVFFVASLLLSFISLPGILQGELLIAPEFTAWNFSFLFLFTILCTTAIFLHLFRFQELQQRSGKKEHLSTIGGSFFALFTSVCTICYPLFLSLLGIPTALALLPFGGIEFQIISIALLLFSIATTSRAINSSPLCK